MKGCETEELKNWRREVTITREGMEWGEDMNQGTGKSKVIVVIVLE